MFVSRIMAVAAAVAAIAPAAVYAAPVSIVTMSDTPDALVRQAHIQTGDLNLASADGQRALQARVKHAVSEVCSRSDIADKYEMARCRHIALTGAQQQIASAVALSTSRYAEAKPAQAHATTASGS